MVDDHCTNGNRLRSFEMTIVMSLKERDAKKINSRSPAVLVHGVHMMSGTTRDLNPKLRPIVNRYEMFRLSAIAGWVGVRRLIHSPSRWQRFYLAVPLLGFWAGQSRRFPRASSPEGDPQPKGSTSCNNGDPRGSCGFRTRFYGRRTFSSNHRVLKPIRSMLDRIDLTA